MVSCGALSPWGVLFYSSTPKIDRELPLFNDLARIWDGLRLQFWQSDQRIIGTVAAAIINGSMWYHVTLWSVVSLVNAQNWSRTANFCVGWEQLYWLRYHLLVGNVAVLRSNGPMWYRIIVCCVAVSFNSQKWWRTMSASNSWQARTRPCSSTNWSWKRSDDWFAKETTGKPHLPSNFSLFACVSFRSSFLPL